jgi:hypothetical protein
MRLGFSGTMPSGFLKIGFNSWSKLDPGVRRVVAELAESQKFRCALCPATRNLVIDHDHEPEEGPGQPYTALNIRGLVCSRCNWHLMAYEKQESGEYFGWENAYPCISSYEYETYDHMYRCRVRPLIEAVLEQRMGSANYWRRDTILRKFDAWYIDRERSEWRERWKRSQAWKIETPEQFIECVGAVTKFFAQKLEKDPDYELPDEFIVFVGKTRRFLHEVFQEAGLPVPPPRPPEGRPRQARHDGKLFASHISGNLHY